MKATLNSTHVGIRAFLYRLRMRSYCFIASDPLKLYKYVVFKGRFNCRMSGNKATNLFNFIINIYLIEFMTFIVKMYFITNLLYSLNLLLFLICT